MADSEPQVTQELRYLTLGPPLIGWLLQIFMSGLCFSYATRQISDRVYHSRRTKVIVATVCCLNTVVLGFTIYEVFFWTTLFNPSYIELVTFKPADAIVSVPGSLTAACVQSVFAYRAYNVLGKKKAFLFVIGLLILVSFSAAIAVVGLALDPATQTFPSIPIATCVNLWLSSAAACDLSISCVLLGGLWKYRQGYSCTLNDTFSWIMMLAFQSALMTSTFAIAAVVTCGVLWNYTSGSVYCAFQYPLPSIYTFSLLWSYESSAKLKEKGVNGSRELSHPTGMFSLTTEPISVTPASNKVELRNAEAISIKSLELRRNEYSDDSFV